MDNSGDKVPKDGQGYKQKNWPDVKPWVRRVVEAAGVDAGSGDGAEKLMGWWDTGDI